MSTIVFIIIFCSSFSVFSQVNHLVLMGGGGEPNGPTTIFDKGLKNLSKFTNEEKLNWIPDIAFNGGHPETEKILRSLVDKNIYSPIKSFTPDTYEEKISRYEKKILDGDVKSGDKILLMIDTHGSPSSEDETHKISTIGYNTVSIDRLQRLINLAEEKGVKLAIVDASCYSGNTLNLKSKKTCIMSAASAESIGSTSWNEKFSENLKKGRNLEEIFLKLLMTERMLHFLRSQLKQEKLLKIISFFL